MTRTISLITATVGAALLFAVPAYGDNWGADQRSERVGYLHPDSVDRAAAVKQQQVTSMLDAREQSQTVAAKPEKVATIRLGERFVPSAPAAPVIQGERFVDGGKSTPVTTSGGSSGTAFNWSQVGFGLGIGLLLALGLYVAMRFTRSRPLAH